MDGKKPDDSRELRKAMRDFKKKDFSDINWEGIPRDVHDDIVEQVAGKPNFTRLTIEAQNYVHENWEKEVVDVAFGIADWLEWQKEFSKEQYEFAMKCAVQVIGELRVDQILEELIDKELRDCISAYHCSC